MTTEERDKPKTTRKRTTKAKSEAESIGDYASKEGVDLIAMYTHARTGLSKLLKGSVTADVKKRVSVEVQAFETSQLAQLAAK